MNILRVTYLLNLRQYSASVTVLTGRASVTIHSEPCETEAEAIGHIVLNASDVLGFSIERETYKDEVAE